MQLALQVYTAIVPQSGAAASLASVPSSFRSCGMICVLKHDIEAHAWPYDTCQQLL